MRLVEESGRLHGKVAVGVRPWVLILGWTAAVFVGGIAAAQTPSEVPFSTIAAGKISGVRTPTQIVVRDVAAWRSLWARHAGSGGVPPLPDRAPPPRHAPSGLCPAADAAGAAAVSGILNQVPSVQELR